MKLKLGYLGKELYSGYLRVEFHSDYFWVDFLRIFLGCFKIIGIFPGESKSYSNISDGKNESSEISLVMHIRLFLLLLLYDSFVTSLAEDQSVHGDDGR